jgi:hypothetical protein
MVRLFFVLALLTFSGTFAQEASPFNKSITYELDEALIRKDTASLANLLHNNLTMGHSNGWLETKSALLQTLTSGDLTYNSIIKKSDLLIYHQTEKLLSTRRAIDVSGFLGEASFEVQLNVMEIWIFENNRWQLLARQSVNRKK